MVWDAAAAHLLLGIQERKQAVEADIKVRGRYWPSLRSRLFMCVAV